MFIASLRQFVESPKRETDKWNKAVAVYGGLPRTAQTKLRRLRNAEFLIEESDSKKDSFESPLTSKADIVPATSFAYLTTELLNKKSA